MTRRSRFDVNAKNHAVRGKSNNALLLVLNRGASLVRRHGAGAREAGGRRPGGRVETRGRGAIDAVARLSRGRRRRRAHAGPRARDERRHGEPGARARGPRVHPPRGRGRRGGEGDCSRARRRARERSRRGGAVRSRRGRARGGDQGARRGRLRAARRGALSRAFFPGRRRRPRRVFAHRGNHGRRGRRAGDACIGRVARAGRPVSERPAARRRRRRRTRGPESAIEFRRRARRRAGGSASACGDERASCDWSNDFESLRRRDERDGDERTNLSNRHRNDTERRNLRSRFVFVAAEVEPRARVRGRAFSADRSRGPDRDG